MITFDNIKEVLIDKGIKFDDLVDNYGFIDIHNTKYDINYSITISYKTENEFIPKFVFKLYIVSYKSQSLYLKDTSDNIRRIDETKQDLEENIDRIFQDFDKLLIDYSNNNTPFGTSNLEISLWNEKDKSFEENRTLNAERIGRFILENCPKYLTYKPQYMNNKVEHFKVNLKLKI